PDRLYQLAAGPEVLRRDRDFALPRPAVMLLLLLAPPVLCGGWYWVWRLRNPDGLRLARQRRSRAGSQALASLQLLARSDRAGVQEMAAIVTTYLQDRLDFPVFEPTPAEVLAHLEHAGYTATVGAQAAAWFQACDAARFSGEHARKQTDQMRLA